MAAKLSKKELKEPDVFQSTFERITDYISENTIRFFAIAATVILTVVIAFGIYLYWSNYQTTAAQIYAKAQASMSRSTVDPEATRESMNIFQELIDKYPHSWSARMAHYHLGNLYYNFGEIDNAITSYKKFVSSTTADECRN